MKRGNLIKGIFIFIGLIVVISLMAIACGTKTTTTTTSAAAPTTTTSKPAVTTTQAPTVNPTTTMIPTTSASAKITTGGTLYYGYDQDMPTIGNPATQQYVTGWGPISDICLENLLLLDSTGTPEPWLATGWKWDADNLGLTLTIRQGVKFHDGTDFNADAVKWNLMQCKAANVTELASVKSIDVVDPYTVKINLSVTDGMLIFNLAGNRGMMMSPAAYTSHGGTEKERTMWAEQNPVGTGPFKFVSWTKGVRITFEKNPNYWQPGKPYLDKIVFTVINDEMTLGSSFQAGEQNTIYSQSPSVIKNLMDTGKYDFYSGDVSLIGGLEGDSRHPDSPWSKIQVRQAAAYSVDSAAFAKAIGYGQWLATNQYDIPGRWGYNPSVVGYPYNTAKSKELLTAAGFPSGFSTNIYGMPQYDTMVASIQAYFAAVGIKGAAQLVTPATRVDMFSNSGWNGCWLWESTPNPNSAYQIVRSFTPAAWPKRMTSVDVPAEMSDLAAKLSTTTDFNTQKQLAQQFQYVNEDKYAMITFIWARYQPQPILKNTHNLWNNVSMHWTPWDTYIDK
ncbi:MAG TPA: ABC transporter substrate-binding protein [Dehalococcoidales bacterium]|nr:ABC transporter substrate-binding protein [Dehalococcoidales bacterium]